MDTILMAGFALIIIGGVMEGGYALALKYTPRWNWENIWGAGSLMAMILVPWPVAAMTIPGLIDVYQSSSATSIWVTLLFGAGWGAGGIFFGLGVNVVGLAMGLSLIMGMIAINGSVIPLMMEHPEQLTQTSGQVMMMGIAIMIFGLVVCALAGHRKDRALRGSQSASTDDTGIKPSFTTGLILCITSGILSPLVNFGLIYGNEVSEQAVKHGADPGYASNAIWALVFTSNYLVNIGYCVYLYKKNGSGSKFLQAGTGGYWAWATVMGVLWAGGVVLYGMGAFQLGDFGAYIGFPILLISSIVTGNILGLVTGEWKGSGTQPLRIMGGGVILLLLAIAVLGYANSLMA